MRTVWLALWFVVLGWDALSPHVLRPTPRLGIWALAIAAILLAVPRGGRERWITPGLSAALAVGCAVTAVLLPWPERLGFVLVAGGALISALPWLGERFGGALWRGPAALGGLLVLAAVTSHLYRLAEAAWHDLGFLAGSIAAVSRWLGASAVADPPFVHVEGVGTLLTFDVSLEKLVGHPLAVYVAAALGVLLVLRGREIGWRKPLVLVGSALGFALVRALALALVLNEVSGPWIYWGRMWSMGGLLVLVAVLWMVLPNHAVEPGTRGRGRVTHDMGYRGPTRRGAVALIASAIAFGALAAASFGFFDPGSPKPGRVLIDEGHSNWEWSTIELNTESYGVQTVYNYSELVRYLRHFYEVSPNFEPLTDDLLTSADVVVLKTPTSEYSDEEVESLVRFVERGGGLWLVGDHTNVFGMSTNLNKVAQRFGLRYRFDAVIDLLSHGRQLFERPEMFPHPSIAHLPPLLMATSSSLIGPPLGRRVMLGRSLLSDELDYSVNTFFGNFEPDSHEPFGSMLQAMAVTRGRGRVLAFTDSTIFSNFFMFIKGKRELALGSVAWLMLENRWAWAHQALLWAAGAALLIWVVVALRVPRSLGLVSLGVAAAPAFAVAAFCLNAWVAGWSALPEPVSPMRQVAFSRERTAFHVPERTALSQRSEHSYHTFYVWTQRVGYIPRTDSLMGSIEDAEVTVLMNPRGNFGSASLDRLEDYVRGGGSLVVLDRPHVMESTANAVLERFGLHMNQDPMEEAAVYDAVTRDSLHMKRVGTVDGGTPVLVLEDGRATLAVSELGDGRVVAVSGADNFTDAVLGKTSEVPDPHQLRLYRLQFRIFDELLKSSRVGRTGSPGDQRG